MNKQHKILTIHGKVQGVFYRENAIKKALELGICGWIKNMFNGSVLCHIEGEEDKLDEFISWCQIGSKLAKVDNIEIKDDNLANFSDFIIKY